MGKLSSFAAKYIGTKQGTKGHKAIVDKYNQITPLPRGYRVKYTDNWCATFVSFVLYSCGLTKNLYECGANRMRDKMTSYMIDDITTGKADDIIFYDWDSNGWSDHVGIIKSVSKTSYTVIEGNKSRQVGLRIIAKSSKSIQGVARLPKKLFK